MVDIVGNTGRRLSKIGKNSRSPREIMPNVKLNGRNAGKAVPVKEMQKHQKTAN